MNSLCKFHKLNKTFLPFYLENKNVSTSTLAPIFTNRNSRSLEKIRIACKPDGYHVEKPGRCFWHKLELRVSGRYVTASIVHFENGEVIKASTSEWAIKKQLFKTTDSAAFTNLGRVLAFRCLQSGITEISSWITPPKVDGKVDLFLKALTQGGVQLNEPSQYKPDRPWDMYRQEKPWEVVG